MKIFKIFIILLLITSCSDKINENKITEFDKILGTENSKTLNSLVVEFENDFLKRQYPNLNIERAYLKFITEISEGEIEKFVGFSQKSRSLFDKSTLRPEIYCVPDSIWVDKNPWNDLTLLVKIRTKCIKPDGTFESGISEMPFDKKEISRDFIEEKRKNFVVSNYNGKYIKALNSISDNSEFLKSFVKDRTNFGLIPSELVAKRILAYNVDITDYYVKRIIVMELAY
ncbi:hypothetical protein [Mariniflexile sp. AS56]|uniref:hypothetical protein n=1 Tax=Mariniflexile sp. AS56 TaxID=3063957 RepID=UPI0026F10B5E|nr:hypothetical protein [Mariniflexile sp. AS56]MDO7174205.1 hypothetical protein [Mariniflexile sp. AS56]